MDITELAKEDKVFFTADHHFGHDNIIGFTGRPFADIYEMDQTLIANWNRFIKHDCVVFHLGDFTLMDGARAAQYFESLNGRIFVLGVPWHHDKRWLPYDKPDPYRSYDGHPVTILPPEFSLDFRFSEQQKHPFSIHLSHYPMGDWDRKFHGGWHFHGHSHGQHKGDNYLTGEMCWDVGVDGKAMNYTPVHFGSILEWAYECNWGTR